MLIRLRLQGKLVSIIQGTEKGGGVEYDLYVIQTLILCFEFILQMPRQET